MTLTLLVGIAIGALVTAGLAAADAEIRHRIERRRQLARLLPTAPAHWDR